MSPTEPAAALGHDLLAAMPLPVYTWRRGDDGTVRLQGYNAEAARWTRGAVAGVLGIEAERMYPDAPEIVAELNACLNEQQVLRRRMEYRFRSTHEVRHLAVTYAPAGPDTVLVYTVDVSDEHAAQVERQRARRLSDRLLGLSEQLAALDHASLQAGLDHTLEALADELGLRQCLLLRQATPAGLLKARSAWRAPDAPRGPVTFGLDAYPLLATALQGEAVSWRQGEPPPSSGAERLALDPQQTKAFLAQPVAVSGCTSHVLVLHHGHDPAGLSGWVQERVAVLARLLGSALTRVAAEVELRRSRARLQGLVDTAPNGLLLVDPHGRLISLNPAARLLLAVGGPAVDRLRDTFRFEAVVTAAGFDPDLDPMARPTGLMLGGEQPLSVIKAAMGLPVVPADEGRYVVAHFMRVREGGVDEGALRLQDVTEVRTLRARLAAARARGR